MGHIKSHSDLISLRHIFFQSQKCSILRGVQTFYTIPTIGLDFIRLSQRTSILIIID